MTIVLTYDSVLSRVQIAVTALPTGVDYVLIERSLNQVTWTTVRGGSEVTVSANAAHLDDYEFQPDIENYYRASAVDSGPITYVGVGAAATGNNASVAPALPVGWEVGDAALILASIRNSGTGSPDTPSGWTQIAATDCMALYGRRLAASTTAPTITFTAGAAGADTIAQCAVWRNAAGTYTDLPIAQNNTSAQNIAYPDLSPTAAGQLVVAAGWKQDDWTSVAGAFGTEIAETPVTAGSDAGQVWNYSVQTTATPIASGSWTVTGGAAAISRSMIVDIGPAPWRTQETDSITPMIDAVWLKSIERPFLNMQVTVRDVGEVVRPSRVGVFQIVGRSFPVAVTDVRQSRQFMLELRTRTPEEAASLILLLASGDVLYIQVPTTGRSSQVVPTAYVSVGDLAERRPTTTTAVRMFGLPCTEVAAPGPDVVGATVTWQSVLNTYGTWADLFHDHDDWASVLALVGAPSDVIVP